MAGALPLHPREFLANGVADDLRSGRDRAHRGPHGLDGVEIRVFEANVHLLLHAGRITRKRGTVNTPLDRRRIRCYTLRIDSIGSDSMTYYLRAYRWHFFFVCVAFSAGMLVERHLL
jgi:hypothetical protein